jgi:endonuclease/exonuclease/phosphatase family metal-dependent hydrolase
MAPNTPTMQPLTVMRSRVVSAIVVAAVVAAAIVVAPPSAAAQPVTVRVMTLNILYGGDELDLETGGWCSRPRGCRDALRQVVRTIRRSGADVVGLQEPINNTGWIANRLGWHADARNHVISRYPVIDPPTGRGIYAFVELAPGEVIAVANVHLPSTPYSPYMIRNGRPRDRIIRVEERYRLPEIQRHLRVLPRLAARGIPVFFTGDFNSPSHLDYTRTAVEARGLPYTIRWPVAKALADAGFRDSYRDAHPDPVATPGFTWTPGVPRLRANEVHDRIDWVLAAGPSTTLSSELVGEVGGPDVDIEVDPYVTDHRGVVSAFTVTPGAPPIMVAPSQRRVFRGDDLAVRFHARGRAGERVALVPAGGRPADALRSRRTGGSTDGEVMFRTAGMRRGAYDAILVGPAGRALSRMTFWLYPPGTEPHVWTSRRVFRQGEPIELSWRAAPGNRYDWFGIFRPGDQHPLAHVCDAGYCGNWRYLLYGYADSKVQGSTRFGPGSFPGYAEWPLKRGWYEIRMFADDGYRLLAVSPPFRVLKRR